MEARKIKKTFIVSFLFLAYLILMFFMLFNFNLLNNFSSVPFDKNKLTFASSVANVFDNEKKEIKPNLTEIKVASFEDIPKSVIDAFVSIEDKNFFRHKGVNYKRILKAFIKNIKSGSMVEGASTISQQLIKNTHLTNKKTLKRKIDEVLLTKKLENTLSKKEILTAYLNAIYFGSNTFGINCAAQRYFSKNVSDLDIAESATLAGIIKSPRKYSPIHEGKNCLQRRNLVLKEMFKDGKISKDEFEINKNKDLNLKINQNFLGNNNYYSNAIDEACNILKISEKDLLLNGFQIYTYMDDRTQDILEEQVSSCQDISSKICDEKNIDCLAMIIDNSTGGIKGYYGKSEYNLNNIYRQPGSAFKPIISYAPAIENNLISTLTPILDEKYTIGDYTPKNYKDKYYGWISAKEALAKSLNIPSVKILENVGIEKAKDFCGKMNIKFDEKDNNLSLALGGLTNGIKFIKLVNCYQAFGNGGKYIKASFIKEIRDKNNVIVYKNPENKKTVMKDSTAFLITDMLKEVVKSGTSKALKNSKVEIASKTGTVGVNNSKNENCDLWNISYTKSITACVWCGSTKNNKFLNKNLTGGNLPTIIAKNIYNDLDLQDENFDLPNSVEKLKLCKLDLDENKIVLADENTPERYVVESYFAKDNKPKKTTTMLEDIDNVEISAKKIDKNIICLSFECKNFLEYTLIKECEDNKEEVLKIKNKNGKIEFFDKNIKENNLYTYTLEVKFLDSLHINSNIKKKSTIKIYLAQKTPSYITNFGF